MKKKNVLKQIAAALAAKSGVPPRRLAYGDIKSALLRSNVFV